MKPILTIENITAGYHSKPVIQDINLKITAGEFLGIIGPNGSGKSTLIRVIGRYKKPWSGHIWLRGEDIHQMHAGTVAKSVAVVPQEIQVAFPYTVEEIVFLGRLPYLKWWRKEDEEDYRIVEGCLKRIYAGDICGKLWHELSSGEKQKVVIAKALAQEPEILLLDEPTSHLDINHQLEIMQILSQMNRNEGVTIVAVLHDLNLASIYCSRLAALNHGNLFSVGSPEEVITAENVRSLYGAKVEVEKSQVDGKPRIVY